MCFLATDQNLHLGAERWGKAMVEGKEELGHHGGIMTRWVWVGVDGKVVGWKVTRKENSKWTQTFKIFLFPPREEQVWLEKMSPSVDTGSVSSLKSSKPGFDSSCVTWDKLHNLSVPFLFHL